MRTVIYFYSDHVDLLGFLDYEIWKASHMLAQNIPLRKNIHLNNEIWEDFGPLWKEPGKEQ